MSAWNKMRLSEICVLITKGTTPTTLGYKFAERGVNFVKSESISFDGRIDTSKFAFIDEATHQGLSRSIIAENDILFSMAGVYLGKTAVVPKEILPANSNQAVGIIRLDKSKAEPRFIDYFIRNKSYNLFLNNLVSQSAQPNFNLTEIRNLPISLPSLPEQRAIASVLGALDDKIELNRRMNETLEPLAQSLFKSWFVDATQSALPKGWREGKVSDLATLNRDGLNPGEFPDETFDHYSLPAFDEGRTPKPERGDSIMSNKFIVPPDCVMVSKLNPRIPRIWLPDLRGQNRAVCSTEFLVATPKPGVSREFLYCLFVNESFVSVFTTMVTGTSGSHQRVRPESLLNMDTPIPPAPLIQKFTATVAPMLKRISQNIHESRTLAALRDALLPKLLSGEFRLNNKARMDYIPENESGL